MILQPIVFRRRLAAAASPDRFYLNTHVEALEAEHPDRLFVSFMCCYARDVIEGTLPGPYTDDHAELYARCALVPDDDFRRCQRLSDADLAERYGVPLDQIEPKRRDLIRPERIVHPDHRRV